VSFATEDRRAAEAAVEALESNGYSCWVAWRDIPESVPYAAAIVQGIRGARVLLVLLTPESRSSPHVLREVECAVAANRPILTVQMAGCLPGEALAYYLGPTQWLRNDQTELAGGPLVQAVAKLAKDARSIDKGVDGSRTLLALFRGAVRFPVGILFVTGLALVAVTRALAHFFLRDTIRGASITAAQNRSILLVLLGCFLSAAFVIEDAIERRRAPYNPLRGRSVPSYAVVAGLFLIFGLWIWSLATGVSPAFLATGSSPAFTYSDGIGIPDFLTGTGDTTSFWWKIQTVFSLKPYAWDHASIPLIVFVATAMVLGSVALCIQRLVHSSALAISIIAMLPFLLVRCAFNGVGADNAPSPLYWVVAVCAPLLSLWLRFVVRSRWLSPLATLKPGSQLLRGQSR
jgi:hypothetical protein